jgi:hypothetical protein
MKLEKTYAQPAEPLPLESFSFKPEMWEHEGAAPIVGSLDCDGDVEVERESADDLGVVGFCLLLSPGEAIALGEALTMLGRSGERQQAESE